MLFWPVIGVMYFIFRLWLTEVKLVEELDFQRHFMSRILNLYLALVLIGNFQFQIFNFIVLIVLPVMFLSLVTADIRFFKRYHERFFDVQNSQRIWFLIERITLHIPLVF